MSKYDDDTKDNLMKAIKDFIEDRKEDESGMICFEIMETVGHALIEYLPKSDKK